MASRLRHQPALDGLRALAVVAVLLYHGGVAWAGGGFLGVDVFFALSGYLITSLLLAEHATTGRIALAAFWVRRARRLLPALLLVLVAVAAYAALIADPSELERIRGDGLASLLYVGNWRMVFAGESYFEQFAAPSPLRHMWSLAIEEQWYVVWPLAVAGLLGLRRGGRGALLATIGAAAIASIVAMALLTDTGDPSRAYYGTDTRAHALLLGAGLAVVFAIRGKQAVGRAGQISGVAGVGVLAVLVVSVTDADRWMYRGGFAVAAVASCAVVAAAVAPAGPVRRLLALRPLPALGRISYGVYLWHWPVYVAMTSQRVGVGGPALLAARLAVTLALAVASYNLVELPWRSSRIRLPRPALSVPAVGSAVAAAVVVATFGAGPTAAAGSADPVVPIADASAEGPPRVLVAGDSVALTLSFNVPSEALEGKLEVASGAIIGCGVMRTVRYGGPSILEPTEHCRQWPERWQSSMERWKPDVGVLLLGAWEVFDVVIDGERLPFGHPAHEALFREELRRGLDILGAGDTDVAVLTVPCFRHFDDDMFRQGSERNDARRIAWINDILREEAARRSDTRVLDFGEWLCPGGAYRDEIDGVRVRDVDGVHLARTGLPPLWRWLRTELASAGLTAS